jgi:hypothetical protein
LVCTALLVGCLQPRPAATQIADFTAAESCIQQHWGEPIENLAGECVGGEVAVAEDLIADIEAIAEGGAVLAGSDPAKVRTSFPYTSLASKVDAKRAALPSRRAAR